MGALQALTDALVRRNVLGPEEAEQIRAGFLHDRAAAAPQIAPLMVTNITESFMISLSLAFYAGIVITFPFLLYYIAEFVLPALSRQEKRYLLPGIGIGFVLFALGVFTCFKLILPETLEFGFGGAGLAMIHDSGPKRGRRARMGRRFPDARVVVFGHSHIPNLEDEDGLMLLNPGSPTDRRRRPRHTFALLRAEEGEVRAEILPL